MHTTRCVALFQDWPHFTGKGLEEDSEANRAPAGLLGGSAVPGCPPCLHRVLDQALLCLQPNEYIKTLADMKVTLKELCWLLRDERRSLTELQQQFAKAKATWETERAELKGHASQVSLPACRGHLPRSQPDLDRQVLEEGTKMCSWVHRMACTSPCAPERLARM